MMRTLAWRVRPLWVLSTALLLEPALWGSHAALGQEPQKTRPALAVGAEVVLKSFRISLDDDGRQVPADPESFRIDRFEGERVRISALDGNKHGWVRPDQIVPVSQAIDFFTAEIAKNPQDTDALWTRARLWIERNDLDRALADYDEIIRLVPDYAPSYVLRSKSLLRKGRIDQALAGLDKAIQLDPKDAGTYKERSKVWAVKQDYRRARGDLDEAIRLRPADAQAWVLRSFAWQSQGNLDEAIKDLNEAIRLAPSSRRFVLRGMLWFEGKQFDRAIADYNEAIKLDANDAQAYYSRGHAWGRKHDRDKQIADFTEAIRLAPKNADFRIGRGLAWSARGMHDEAIADFDEAVRLAPNDASAYRTRGLEWEKDAIAGKTAPDKAIADFSRAIELDPKNAAGYRLRAGAWRLKHENAKMARDLSSLVEVDDLNPKSHEALARLLATCKDAQVRDGKRAVAEATRACELSHWADADCLDTLAAAYAETGFFAEAVKWVSQAIEIVIKRNGAEEGAMRFRLRCYQNKEPCRE